MVSQELSEAWHKCICLNLALLVSENMEVAIEGTVRRRQNAGVADHIGIGKVGDHEDKGVDAENRLLGMRIARF